MDTNPSILESASMAVPLPQSELEETTVTSTGGENGPQFGSQVDVDVSVNLKSEATENCFKPGKALLDETEALLAQTEALMLMNTGMDMDMDMDMHMDMHTGFPSINDNQSDNGDIVTPELQSPPHCLPFAVTASESESQPHTHMIDGKEDEYSSSLSEAGGSIGTGAEKTLMSRKSSDEIPFQCGISASASISSNSTMMRTLNLDDSVINNSPSSNAKGSGVSIPKVESGSGLSIFHQQSGVVCESNAAMDSNSLENSNSLEKSWYHCEQIPIPEPNLEKSVIICNGQKRQLNSFFDVKEMILRVMLSPSVANENIISTCTRSLREHGYVIKMHSKGCVVGAKDTSAPNANNNASNYNNNSTSIADMQRMKKLQEGVVRVVSDAAAQAAVAAKKIDDFVHKKTGKQYMSLASTFSSTSKAVPIHGLGNDTAVCIVGVEVETKDRVLMIGVNSGNVQDGSGTRTSIFTSIRTALNSAQFLHARVNSSTIGRVSKEKFSGFQLEAIGEIDENESSMSSQQQQNLSVSETDSVMSANLNEMYNNTLHQDYLRDLQASFRILCERDLGEYVRKLDLEVDNLEWNLARLMSLLSKAYNTYGVKLPSLKRCQPLTPPLFDIQNSVTMQEISHVVNQAMVQCNIGRERIGDTLEKIKASINERWQKQTEVRKVRKAEHCQLRIKIVDENTRALITYLRDNEFALKHRETADFAKKVNVPLIECGVVLAQVSALYKKKPGTVYATFSRLFFVSSFFFNYRTKEIFELEQYDRVKVIKELPTPLTMFGAGAMVLYANSTEKAKEVQKNEARIIIPSSSDLDRFSDLVLQILKIRKSEQKQEQQSSSSENPKSNSNFNILMDDQPKFDKDNIIPRAKANAKDNLNLANPGCDMSASTMLRPDEFEV
uniref:Uncharacterized protein n=1 Tax=Aplanochytrium stocchinoi TaxID=215587 RepID=A0A7S3PQ52_9STRA